MPFVQRNWRGEIIGLYSSPQPQQDGTSLTEPEPLPDDHPEVVAYRAKHPVPEGFLKPPTEQEHRRFAAMNKAAEKEHERIRRNVTQFTIAFSGLETALSALLYAMLNIQKSQIAYAIYYSPTSFDARAELVGNALIQLATENKPLADLLEIWTTISDSIRQARNLRNAIAHSSPLTHSINGKLHARLSPPAFDVIRIGRRLAKRQIPGLSAHDIWEGIKKVRALDECVDCVNRLVAEFHDGNPSLQKRYDALKRGLTKLDNP